MSKHYAVAQAACYVTVPGVGSVLLYRDAPVPEAAENIAELEAEGFIVEVEEENLGGLQSDLPLNLESPEEPLSPVVRFGNGDAGDDVDDGSRIPAKSASRAEWDTYAKSQGLSDEEVAAFSSKEELQKHFGVE